MNDKYLSMSEAARLTPRRPSAGTIWRWCRRGVKARNGKRIRLQHVRIGGRIYTTLEWVDEFGRQLAEADIDASQVAHPNRRPLPPHEVAESMLDAEGV